MKTVNSILFLSTLLFFVSCGNTTETAEDTDVLAETENDKPVSDCSTAPKSWFYTDSSGVRVTPAPNEGPTSVFANSETVTNCDFHRWSWQKFLWLTNETNGVPHFQSSFTQVGPDGTILGKGGAIILESFAQASSSIDILKTTTQSATRKNTVYYSIMINDSFKSTMEKYGKMAAKDPNSVKDVTFPVGAVETKSAWIDASSLSDPSSYYTTQGIIDGDSVTVALLGMHVVGVVENHPEFVWATFEHENLAPKYPWSEANDSTDVTVTSSNAYPFFAANASATVENINTQNGIYSNVFSLYDYGTPVEINSNQQKVYTETSQDGETNVKNISELNASVKSQLKGIWNKYFYNGSLWVDMEGYKTNLEQAELLNTLSDSLNLATPGKLLRGSVSAYNITMETYVQAGFDAASIHGIEVKNYVNCFYCHSAKHNGTDSPLHVSHLFNGYVGSQKGLTKAQIKDLHVSRIRAKAILNTINKK